MKSNALIIALMLFSGLAHSQSALLRGPYLNSGTPSSMVVRWRTLGAEAGEVRYGLTPSALHEVVAESNATVEHEVRITGLQPFTEYFYSVGASGSAYTIADPTFHFKTSPAGGTSPDVRLWAMGDFGNGSRAQQAVKEAYQQHFGDRHTDVWLWLGDNAYGSGTDQEYQEKVFEVYPEMLRNTVAWPCPGNHDYGSIDLANNGPYYDIFTLPQEGEAGGVPSGTEGYYSFDYGDIHFLSLNTEYLVYIALPGTPFQQWLEQDLQQNTKKWVVAMFHQSPYSKGTHDSDDNFSRPQFMRQNVLPLLEQYGTDLVLTGHSHGYERSYLIKGHFGKSGTWNPSAMLLNGTSGNAAEGEAYVKHTVGEGANHGTVYAVVGCSGQKGSGNHPLNHPVMHISTEDYHGSMVIDVSGDELFARFIDTTGAVLDQFSILKSATPASVPPRHPHTLSMNVFPNPHHGIFRVSLSLPQAEEVTLRFRDLSGREWYRAGPTKLSAGEHGFEVSLPGQPSRGIGIMELRTATGLSVKRLVREE